MIFKCKELFKVQKPDITKTKIYKVDFTKVKGKHHNDIIKNMYKNNNHNTQNQIKR